MSPAMDNAEAADLLRRELAGWRGRTWDELREAIGDPHVVEVTGPSGARYTIETEVLWDGVSGGSIRVLASIDDGGRSAFRPMTDDFIKSPDHSGP